MNQFSFGQLLAICVAIFLLLTIIYVFVDRICTCIERCSIEKEREEENDITR